MKSDELPAWLKPHLPAAAPRDATATRRSRPAAPSTLSPEVQRRINNLTATMGRTVGPVTPGNHSVGLMDVANLVGGGVSTALRAAGVPLDKLDEMASARRGNVTEPAPIDFSKMDPRQAAKLQLAAMHGGGADDMLAAIIPAATRGEGMEPSLISHMSLDDMRASLARQRAALDRPTPRAANVPLGTATTDGLADARRLLRTMQHNSGSVNMPRVKAVDPEKAAQMAQVYAGLPAHDPNAASAYDALNKEVAQQFQSILDNGHKIEFTDTDPYKTSKEMIADVRDNRRLKVFKTPGDGAHPFMTADQNNKFRAVHDWLAHAGEGHSFGPIGEENAYRVHASTLSPEAQRALATETRGQNSWVNFGPNAHLPPAQRPFADQKAALWPAELTGDYHEMPAPVMADSAVAQAPAFYSRLERAIQSAPMKKGTSAQWMAHLSKNVSAEERDWTGVDKFLKSTSGPVTQDQVQKVFDAGKIKLGRTTLSDPKPNMKSKYALPEVLSAARDAGATPGDLQLTIANDGDAYRALTDRFPELVEDPEWAETVVGDVFGTASKPTKFGQYTEPGGTNYRENLTTLPPQAASPFDPSKVKIVRMPRSATQGEYSVAYDGRDLGSFDMSRPSTGRPGVSPQERESPFFWTDQEIIDNMRRRYDSDGKYGQITMRNSGFRSSHFDEPNILLHTRTKDRELSQYGPNDISDIEQRIMQAVGAKRASYLGSGAPSAAVKKGLVTPEEAQAWGATRFPNSPDFTMPSSGKVLHAEEIQSDWHQQGRAKGYRADPLTPDDVEMSQVLPGPDAHPQAAPYWESHDRRTGQLITRHPGSMTEDAARREAIAFGPRGEVPNAPFKKTEDWQLLGIKQLIDDAVRGGYDHVAWTPGQLQADRYSLAKQVDDIHYDPQQGHFVARKNGINVHIGNYAPEALPSVIGKEAADRLLHPDNTGPSGFQRLSGDDLSIGGSGMKGFYDNMLPKNLNKYFKSLNLGDGTPQLGTTEMHFNQPGELSVQQMPSFPITPALRQMVLTKGQPLLTLMGALGLGGAAGLTQDGTNPPQQ